MQYHEILPDNSFSNHTECYWHLSAFENVDDPVKLLMPTCTFNIIFLDQPCFIKSIKDKQWISLAAGPYFVGQRNFCVQIKSKKPLMIYGLRFKPFAFAEWFDTAVFKLNDIFTPLKDLFPINKTTTQLIEQILLPNKFELKSQLLDELLATLFKKNLSIDEKLRAQLNYILDRRGLAKISDLFGEFKTSKVTLHKHFINKVGLSPKKVAQIWRMNYFLQLKEEAPNENFTSMCLDAGFYDQSHFIKEFKLLFGSPPRKFFLQNVPLIKLEHYNIARRFGNQYDPR
jgi:AraC-like DNA-binding protein